MTKDEQAYAQQVLEELRYSRHIFGATANLDAEIAAQASKVHDLQERCIIEAAIAHVVANGPCDNMDDDEYDAENNPYCDDEACTYCDLSRAMEGYYE